MARPKPKSPDSDSPRHKIWSLVHRELLRHALPDSRFDYDFLHFVPDFRGSDAALAHLVSLPAYVDANTILVTPDNSLRRLRARALTDGKRVIVGTHGLRRSFVLLDPGRVAEADVQLAACLDGMEGLGRALSLAEMRDEGVKIDMCVMGALALSTRGVTIWEGAAFFEVQWALLQDVGVLGPQTRVVGFAHRCQVVDEKVLKMEVFEAKEVGEVQCDFVVTDERVFEIEGAVKYAGGVDFENVDLKALEQIMPLQELRGIRMVEKMMGESGFGKKEEEEKKEPTKEEQMGIDIVEKLMRGLKG